MTDDINSKWITNATSVTNQFSQKPQPIVTQPDIMFQAVPDPNRRVGDRQHPVWRIRLDIAGMSGKAIGLDINGDVILGRGNGNPALINLSPYGADDKGVSRHHVLLRPTGSKLFAIDLDSTNGTLRNGRSIGVNTPYALTNGDLLSLGQFEVAVRLIRRPSGQSTNLLETPDLGDALAQLAQSITSQLDLEDVFSQTLEMAMTMSSAGEVAIWLVDEKSGELYLEAERGIADETIKRLRIPVKDTIAGKVIESGQALRATRDPASGQIKLKTDYLVEAVVYVPLTVGGVTIGVLSAIHREAGKSFNAYDERLLVAIGDFTAIAIQNSRVYEAVDRTLSERMGELVQINNTLAHDLRGLLTSIKGYADLIKISPNVPDDEKKFAEGILRGSHNMLEMVNEMLDISLLGTSDSLRLEKTNVSEMVVKVLGNLEGAALVKGIELDYEETGNLELMVVDESRLYRAVLNLVDNAIKYSPDDSQVYTKVIYLGDTMQISVRDNGEGIPPEDLDRLFERFYRGKQKESEKMGVGLGLSMVKVTVEAHGGTVVAANAPEGGAIFTITLPVKVTLGK